jgi:hypothetical protein
VVGFLISDAESTELVQLIAQVADGMAAMAICQRSRLSLQAPVGIGQFVLPRFPMSRRATDRGLSCN